MDHIITELVLQRDYLLGMLVQAQLPPRSRRARQKELRQELIQQASRTGEPYDSIREVGKY